jgi:hypothetical protein
MAIDLLAISLLTRAGGFFLGLAAALLFLRLALASKGATASRTRGGVFGCLGIGILLITLAAGYDALTDGIGSLSDLDDAVSTDSVPFGEVGTTIAELLALRGADTEEEARAAAEKFAARLGRFEGASPADIEEVLSTVLDTVDNPWAGQVISSVIQSLDAAAVDAAGDTDSMIIAYADALESEDSVTADALRLSLARVLAAQDLDRLEHQVARLEERNRELTGDLDELEERGLIRWLLKIADQVGIGFGWSGLYFTLFIALFKGRTPGKRLLGIRVVRLDGKPIGWWAAFNRFGGYAASIFTGLLGFFEMFWDPNRQALHDRIASTVVIRE